MVQFVVGKTPTGKAILSTDEGCVALYQGVFFPSLGEGVFFPSLGEGDAEVTPQTLKICGEGCNACLSVNIRKGRCASM